MQAFFRQDLFFFIFFSQTDYLLIKVLIFQKNAEKSSKNFKTFFGGVLTC